MFRQAIILALLLLTSDIGYGQLFSRKRATDNEKPPKAILVELPTYGSKMRYYRQRNSQSQLKQLQTDADSMQQRMVMDFNDNFSYCPVYYFIDSNAGQIMNKQFAGLLLDKNLKPVININLDPADYYNVIAFGKPIKDALSYNKPNQSDNDPTDAAYSIGSNTLRLIVMDKDLKMISRPLSNGINNINGGRLKQTPHNYFYNSPKFDIYYRPYARNFSAKLSDFYGAYPY